MKAIERIEGAVGGGHKYASGVQIPVDKVEEFFLTFFGYTEFNEKLDNWNTSSATSMASMFEKATK